jgi:hypothetical protein
MVHLHEISIIIHKIVIYSTELLIYSSTIVKKFDLSYSEHEIGIL